MKPTSIAIPVDTLDLLKTLAKRNSVTTGTMINTILDDYDTPEKVSKAVLEHIKSPVVDPSTIKRTSVYMSDAWVQRLRAWFRESYLPFDAMLRVLVQDWLNRHADLVEQTTLHG